MLEFVLKAILNEKDLMAPCLAFDLFSIGPDCVVYREEGE
jgi:hypothetical protein